MKVALLDASVLIALFYDGHMHHEVAHDWFADNAGAGWASCPLTENALLRILGNPARIDQHVPISRLVEILTTFCTHTKHRFWSDELSFRDRDTFDLSACRGHQQLTDVYLLALAVKHAGRLVTFDRNVSLPAVKGATRAALEVIAPE